jgi:NAD(P)-dependent dehydrogenase (short-subunit alcohol dehydrogenase family)
MGVEAKSIVVTGATRGIGKVTAAHLAASGATVTVVGLDARRGERTVAQIAEAGGSAELVICDLTVESQVASMFDEVRRRVGRVDVVVNNAASTDLTRDRPVAEQTTEDFDHFVRANLYNVFWCFKYGIRAMGADGGAFVTISSIESTHPRPGEMSYATTKAAATALARQVAVEYGDQGIRSNVLVLGFIETNASTHMLHDERLGPIIRRTTGGRPPTSLDVARAVAFLASDDGAGFNGAALTLDRGMSTFGQLPGDLTLGL